MAQTTDAVNACNVVLSVDDSTGTPVDISGSSNQANLDFTLQTAETFTFDGDYAIKKACKKTVGLSINAVYSLNDTEASNILEDWYHNDSINSRTVTIDVPNGSGGSFRYAGEFIIEGYGLPVSAEDAGAIILGFTLSNDGAVTRSAIAS
jgi:hypothetical protein